MVNVYVFTYRPTILPCSSLSITKKVAFKNTSNVMQGEIMGRYWDTEYVYLFTLDLLADAAQW